MAHPPDQRKPEEPKIIPEGASPLRFMVAESEGRPYVNYYTLGDAFADPDAVMVFEADTGGQILLTCPVRYVRAAHAVLTQLLADLEMITWGPGFDLAERAPSEAEIFFERLPVGSGVMGGMGGGLVVDGIWLHDEVGALGVRDQIATILAGDIERLELPQKFPHMELSSLADLRPYPRARVQLHSTIRGLLLVDCLASEVRVNEDRLRELVRQLDAVLENVHPLFSFVAERREPGLRFVPGFDDWRQGGGNFVATPLFLGRGYNDRPIEPLERNREAIGAILAGRNATIR